MVLANGRVRQQNIAVWMPTYDQNLLLYLVVFIVSVSLRRREIATVDHEDVLENGAVFQHGEHRDRLLSHLLLLRHHRR